MSKVNATDGRYRADRAEFKILYYIQEDTAVQLGQVQIFRVIKSADRVQLQADRLAEQLRALGIEPNI